MLLFPTTQPQQHTVPAVSRESFFVRSLVVCNCKICCCCCHEILLLVVLVLVLIIFVQLPTTFSLYYHHNHNLNHHVFPNDCLASLAASGSFDKDRIAAESVRRVVLVLVVDDDDDDCNASDAYYNNVIFPCLVSFDKNGVVVVVIVVIIPVRCRLFGPLVAFAGESRDHYRRVLERSRLVQGVGLEQRQQDGTLAVLGPSIARFHCRTDRRASAGLGLVGTCLATW